MGTGTEGVEMGLMTVGTAVMGAAMTGTAITEEIMAGLAKV
jgi:hypothetical protein